MAPEGDGLVQVREEIPALRIRVLGDFRVERKGELISDAAWQRPKAKVLFKLLVVTPGHRLHREQVEDLLWPGLDGDSAHASFRKALSWARHALEPTLRPRDPSSYLHLAEDMLFLDPERVWIDADVFRRLATHALASESHEGYTEALALYAGELLPEDRYEDWTARERGMLADLNVQLLTALARLLEAQGRYGQAIERLQQALGQDPGREGVHRELMRLYAVSGRRHQALRQYQSCREVLREQYEIEPEPETRSLYETIRAGKVNASTKGASFAHKAVRPVPTSAPDLPPALRGISAITFVGRERPLDLLLRDLFGKDAPEDRRCVALIGGEAGVGKTRLAAEVAREAVRRGALALWGASYEQEGQLPYGPFVEALEGYVGGLSSIERESLASAYPELDQLLPSPMERQQAPSSLAPAESDRGRLFAAVGRLLADLASHRPVLVVLDDLHVADPASLQLLHHLARVRLRDRWLLLGTYREEDVTVGSDLGGLMSALTRAALCRRIELLPLARAECDRLVAAMLPEAKPDAALLQQVFALSMGNPLFATELVREMQEHGEIVPAAGSRAAIEPAYGRPSPRRAPQQVRAIIEARVDRMGEEARKVLGLAATAGIEFSYSVLLAAAEGAYVGALSQAAVLDVLDRSLEMRLVEERGEEYAFRHPLFRAALYERLSDRRRSTLHHAIAHALEQQRPDDVDQLAHHYVRGGDQAKAITYLRGAGDRAAALYANELAAAHYRALLDRLDEAGRAQEAARVREKLGAVLRIMAQYDDALAVLDAATATYRDLEDLESVGRVTALAGRIYALKGDPGSGMARVGAALERFAGRPSTPAVAALHAALASLHRATGNFQECFIVAEQAAEVARSIGDEQNLIDAEWSRAVALLFLERRDEARRALEEVLLLAEASRDLLLLMKTLDGLAVVCGYGGDLQGMRDYRLRALAMAERVGATDETARMRAQVGQALFYLGDWQEAHVHFQSAFDVTSSDGAGSSLTHRYLFSAQLAVGRGEWSNASRYLQQVLQLVAHNHDRHAEAWAHSLVAEEAILEGRAAEAFAHLECFVWGVDRPNFHSMALLAWAHLETGDVVRAVELARQAVEGLRPSIPINLDHALRIYGMALARQKRWEEAEAAFDEAISLARRMPYPHGAALALYERGQVHLLKGETEQAQQRLEEALAIFQRLGARPYLERTEQALARRSRQASAP